MKTMTTTRVLMPSNAQNNDCTRHLIHARASCNELVVKRPGVAVNSIQGSDWISKRVSHFQVSRDAQLVGFALFNHVPIACYCGPRGECPHEITVELSITHFKSGQLLSRQLVRIPANHQSLESKQTVHLKTAVPLEKDQLYEVTAYYDRMVNAYLKSDPFLWVQKTRCGDLQVVFHQMQPKGRYSSLAGYPSEIPELRFK